jgi:hypothetical protein
MNQYGSDYQIRYTGQLGIPTNTNYTVPSNLPIRPPQDLNDFKTESVEYEEYISISSSNRSSDYPLHYDYRINFDSPYKNVKKIEMISAILPNQGASSSSGDILNESHLIIDIEGLNYIEFPNVGKAGLKGFSILPLKKSTKDTGGFIVPELGCIFHKSKVFKTPLANLSHLHIKIRDSEGNLYDFGETSGTNSKTHQNHFVFKITVQEVKRLRTQNVF